MQINVTQIQPNRFVRLKLFEEITGTTAKAAEQKIASGAWIEGRHYVRAPDRTIHIDMEGYNRWLQNQDPNK